MKITLSVHEAEKLLTDHFNSALSSATHLVESIEVVVVYPGEGLPRWEDVNRNAIHTIEAYLNEGMHMKIPAIKELRTAANLGLKPAKDAIENWAKYKELCRKENRWAILPIL